MPETRKPRIKIKENKIKQSKSFFDFVWPALKWRQTSYCSIVTYKFLHETNLHVEPHGAQFTIYQRFWVAEVGRVALQWEAMSHVHMALFVPMRVDIAKGRAYQVVPSMSEEKKPLIRTLHIHSHPRYCAGVLCSLACARSCETHM